MSDPFDLQRFVDAQNPVWDTVLAELAAGRKRGHWIWYVYPQLRGLGMSHKSDYYGITGLDEAQAYLDHTVLGPRLKDSLWRLLAHTDKSAFEILGVLDMWKLRSCLTLFEQADPTSPVFPLAISQFFSGNRDSSTQHLLRSLA